MLYFEWDNWKAAENLGKHGISFDSASVALEDPYGIEEDDQIVDGEVRVVTTGMSDILLVVLVTHTNSEVNDGLDEVARIISARKASPGERRNYDRNRASSIRNAAY